MSWVYGVLRWVRVLLFFYVLVLVLVAVFQRRLIYFPSRASEAEVIAHAASASLEPWRDSEGALIGFLRRERTAPREDDVERPSPVLVLHGNAGFAAHRSYLAQLFPDRSVYILEYPGFGARPGRPGEPAIRSAAEAALRELVASYGPVLILGESIGGGPASWLAGRYPDNVSALVLITPFTTLADVARSQFPVFPVRLLLRDRWENERHLAAYPGPLAVLVAEADRVVPARLGWRLYEEFSGRKQLWSFPGSDHNTIIRDLSGATWREILRFLHVEREGA